MHQDHYFDILIIGSGAAGLSLALKLAEQASVAVLSKDEISEGSTRYAQGGIAAVLDEADSIESHVEDTLMAGGGLCDPEVAYHTASNAKACIYWLMEQGVSFTRDEADETNLHLTREGGHSHRRIIHADDATGLAVQTSLTERVLKHPNIHVFPNHIAVDLIIENKNKPNKKCHGAYVLDENRQQVVVFRARFTVLATGGASKVYLYSTNPDVASGDGISMAWRAGCRVANMEFNQFHPTCLYHSKARTLLLTEAIRGEGGVLRRPDGSRFMPEFDARAELAPRDIVARAIDHEMKRLGVPCMYLDISHQPADFVKKHFPNLYQQLLQYGLDMTRDPLPVVPAAHYTCGGVITNLNGETDIPRLYAIGEVAFTGLHGANRMASNSLLECVVFAAFAGQHILQNLTITEENFLIRPWDDSQVCKSDEQVIIMHNWEELRRFMWNYVGIVRTTKRLERALSRIHLLQAEIHDYYSQFKVNRDLLELRNLVQVSELIIRSALKRKESRGLHFTLDYPTQNQNSSPQNTILIPL